MARDPQGLFGADARPVIGVCGRPVLGSPVGAETLRDCYVAVSHLYTDRVFEAGGLPVVLPYHPDAAAGARDLALRLDGVLFTGGADIDSASFGGAVYDDATHHDLGETQPLRDAFEGALLDACWNLEIPCLGICRGIQIMNVSRGGTLVRDVSEQEWGSKAQIVCHLQGEPFNVPSHGVTVEPNSALARILGTDETMVNSMHHLALAQVPQGAHVVARAFDGTPEALDFPGHVFFMGVQWHPESMGTQPALFEAFVNAARSRMENRLSGEQYR